MLYAYSLKRNTNIGNVLYRNKYMASKILLLLLILIMSITGTALYSYFTDSGYYNFENDMLNGESAKLYVDGGSIFTMLSFSQTGDTFCLYSNQNTNFIILVKKDVLQEKLFPFLTYTQTGENKPSPIYLKGITRKFSDDFNSAIKKDEFLSSFSDSYGTVFLDTTVRTFPTLLYLSLILLIISLLAFVIIYIFSGIKDILIHRTLMKIEAYGRDTFNTLDKQCISCYNIAIGRNTILTDEFCINIKKHDVIPISDIRELYIKPCFHICKRKRSKLIALTSDNKKHIVVCDAYNHECLSEYAKEILTEKSSPS